MYTVYQLVSRIPLPTSLTLGHLPPGGRFVGRETRPLLPEKWQFVRRHNVRACCSILQHARFLVFRLG